MTEIALILRRLVELKKWVLLVALVALFAGMATVVKLDKLPHLERRSNTIGVASAEMLVDARRSVLGDLNSSVEPLATRTSILASISQSSPVVNLIAKKAGLPPGGLAVQAMATTTQTGAERSQGIVNELFTTRVVVRAQPSRPILSISAQAATPEQARVLATATTDALREYFRQFQDTTGATQQSYASLAQLKTLNISGGGAVSSGTSLSKGVMVAFVIFGLGCLAVIFLSGLVTELRTQRADTFRDEERRLDEPINLDNHDELGALDPVGSARR